MIGPVATTVIASFIGSLGTSLAGMPAARGGGVHRLRLGQDIVQEVLQRVQVPAASSRNSIALYQSFQ